LDADGKASVLVRPEVRGRDGDIVPLRQPGAGPLEDDRDAASGSSSRVLILPPPPVIDPPVNQNGTGKSPVADASSSGFQIPSFDLTPDTAPQPRDTSLPDGGSWQAPPSTEPASDPNPEPTLPTSRGILGWPPRDAKNPRGDDARRPIPSPDAKATRPAPIRDLSQQSPAQREEPPKKVSLTIPGTDQPASFTGAMPHEAGNEPDVDLAMNQAASQKPTIDEQTAKQLEPRPWLPLVLTTLALFASLAANLYLGWVALGIYRRYRLVVDQLHHAQLEG
jgi:hypothetical protein